jgi:hypothetical protein
MVRDLDACDRAHIFKEILLRWVDIR